MRQLVTEDVDYEGDMGLQREPETIDGATGLVDPSPKVAKGRGGRRIRLANARCLRQEMAHLYRKVDRGEMASGEMNKRIWALGEMLKAYAIQELEQRLVELEAQKALPA